MNECQRKLLRIICGIMLILLVAVCLPVKAVSSKQDRFFTIHAASYPLESGAASDVKRFQALGCEVFYRRSVVPGKGTWYRVYIGRFDEEFEARLFAENLKSKTALNYYSIQKFDADSRKIAPVKKTAAVKPMAIPEKKSLPSNAEPREQNATEVQPPNVGDSQDADSGQKTESIVKSETAKQSLPSNAEPREQNATEVQPPNVGDSGDANSRSADSVNIDKASVAKGPNDGQTDTQNTIQDDGPGGDEFGLPATALFEKALRAFELSDYQGALNILNAMEARSAEVADIAEQVFRRIADCYYFLAYKMGNSYYLIATERYKKILLEYSGRPENADCFYRMGRSFESLKFYYEALDAYRLLIADCPNSAYEAEASFKICEMLHKTGRFDEAVDHLKSWQRRHSEDRHAKQAAFLLADSYYQLRQAVNAENRYREATQRWPDYGDVDLDLLLNMGTHHDQNRRYADAAHVFSLAASMHPNDARIPDILRTLGRIVQDSGRPQGALMMLGLVLETYSKTSDQSARILADMGIVHPGLRPFGFAGADAYLDPVGTYDHLIAKSGAGEQAAFLMTQKADALRKTGQLEKSVDAYIELLERFPSGPHEEESRHHLKTGAGALVQQHVQAGKDRAAADLYFKTFGRGLIRFDGEDLETGLMLGESLIHMGLPQVAKTLYSNLRSICRNAGCSSRIALGEARAEAADGSSQDAVGSLLSLIANPSGLTEVQIREAKVLAADILMDLKRFEEAAGFYGEALSAGGPFENRIPLQHAAALRQAGNIDASIDAYRKAIRLFLQEDDIPGSLWLEAYAGFGQCCYLQERYADGIAAFEKALAYGDVKDRAWTLHQLVVGLLRMNDRSAAEKRLAELRELDEFWSQAARRWIEESSWLQANQEHLK